MRQKKLWSVSILVSVVILLVVALASCSGNNKDLAYLSKRGYISEQGFPTVIGEVRNDGTVSMKNILITVSFYCSGGRLIGEKEDTPAISSSYTEIEILAPQETSPFKVALSAEEIATLSNFDIDNFEKFKVDGQYDSTSEETFRSFDIINITGHLIDESDLYELTGTVKNIGSITAEQVKVIATFYDEKDMIIEVASTYIEDDLPVSAEAQFRIVVPDEKTSKMINTYSIQAVSY